MINEYQLEQLCMQWFSQAGYDVARGRDIAPESEMPERSDYRQVILKRCLLSALQRINPHLPASCLEEVAHTVAKPDHPILVHNNRTYHKWLLEGVPVTFSQGDETRADHVRLIDFADGGNNRFLAVNQFTVQGARQFRRPDVVVFINGLPIAVVELKNPADETADIWDAFNQLQTYKEEISDLFVFNDALVVSDGITARLGSITANKEWFLPWRTMKSEDDKPDLQFELETVVKGFFDPELLLDYLRHFILFSQEGDTVVKRIAGYHQFHAVREAVRVTLIAAAPAKRDTDGVGEPRATYGKEVRRGSRKAGVVWHTQGAGKSISMACYAGKLLQQAEMNNPTIVVVTDRLDLDGQLYQTFCNAWELLKQMPVQADSRGALREALASRQAGGIIFTTVQKFSLLDGEDVHPAMSNRTNIVVISDEAHRSQYGLKAKLDKKSGKYRFGFARHLRDALPNATFIGFTGTPIALDDRDTQAVFGRYVSIYDIQDAVQDGATVPIFYESRLAKLDINRAEIEQLNQDVEEVFEEEEDLAAREKIKSKWAALTTLVGAEPRIAEVAEDLITHFETRTAVIDGKAMIVCMSRDICVRMFDALTKIRPQWQGTKLADGSLDPMDGAVRVMMTGDASDKGALKPHLYSDKQKAMIAKRFTDPKDALRLVIVRDM